MNIIGIRVEVFENSKLDDNGNCGKDQNSSIYFFLEKKIFEGKSIPDGSMFIHKLNIETLIQSLSLIHDAMHQYVPELIFLYFQLLLGY